MCMYIYIHICIYIYVYYIIRTIHYIKPKSRTKVHQRELPGPLRMEAFRTADIRTGLEDASGSLLSRSWASTSQTRTPGRTHIVRRVAASWYQAQNSRKGRGLSSTLNYSRIRTLVWVRTPNMPSHAPNTLPSKKEGPILQNCTPKQKG